MCSSLGRTTFPLPRSVACSFLCKFEVSWDFLHQACHIFWCHPCSAEIWTTMLVTGLVQLLILLGDTISEKPLSSGSYCLSTPLPRCSRSLRCMWVSRLYPLGLGPQVCFFFFCVCVVVFFSAPCCKEKSSWWLHWSVGSKANVYRLLLGICWFSKLIVVDSLPITMISLILRVRCPVPSTISFSWSGS